MSDANLGRPPVPIERDSQRFEIACIWAFLGFGLGPFDATKRALMVVRGGPISMSDIMGVLRLSQVSVPLPEAKDEPNAAERRLFAMVKRQRPELPVIMITAYDDEERRRTADAFGAAEFLNKPIDFDHLKQRIRAFTPQGPCA